MGGPGPAAGTPPPFPATHRHLHRWPVQGWPRNHRSFPLERSLSEKFNIKKDAGH